jgi:N-acetylglutamate synthase-like GNAT family acetyltransferase
MECAVRAACAADAEDISRVILRALRETNAKDYSPDVIARVEQSFSPAALANLMSQRKVFVATIEQQIVGTASLDGKVVRTLFVTPEMQGHGVGKLLMAVVERTAREDGVEVLAVPSSVTAEQFYLKLGFKAVRDSYHGEERTIVMERTLAGS